MPSPTRDAHPIRRSQTVRTEPGAASLDRLTEARTRGFLILERGDDSALGRTWSAWCAESGRPCITLFRYRGVDQAARSTPRWSFLDLSALECSLLEARLRLTPLGLCAVGRAFVAACPTPDQAWTLVPQRISVGRLARGSDEALAARLVVLLRAPEHVVPS